MTFNAVTQQINSATSIGRLMLNALLSFAQFEREVTSERIRDKFAASKAKGIWMGGPVPFGYVVQNRLLIIEPEGAAMVRRVFTDYMTVRSITEMVKTYAAEGLITCKGGPFTKPSLYKILCSRMYLGELLLKGENFPIRHQPIISHANEMASSL